MNARNYFLVSGIIFTAVAAAHAMRLVWKWTIFFQGWFVPVWLSAVGFLIAGYLAFTAFHLHRQS